MGEEQTHGMSYKQNIWVWAALIVLTAITVGVAEIDFQQLTVIVALLIASTKATLVAMYFMHLKFESKILVAMVVITVVIFFLFTLITLIDYWTR